MRKFIIQHRFYFIILFVWLIIGSILIITTDKFELHTNLTSTRSPFGDTFFKFLTYTGSGLGAITTLIIILVSKNLRTHWLKFILAYGLSIGLVTLSKQVIFPDTERPSLAFQNKGLEVPKIENFRMHKKKTFPSGHTAEMFCCFGFFMILLKKPFFQLGLFIIALLAAYSRVYLFQHFFTDIFVGSMLSLMILSIVFFIFKGKAITK